MKKLKFYLKRIILAAPLAAIAGASFMPLKTWAQQSLVLFALIWLYVILFTEVLGK
jgi:hypothetical protein